MLDGIEVNVKRLLILIPFLLGCELPTDSELETIDLKSRADLEQPCDTSSNMIGIFKDANGFELGFNNNCKGYEQACNVVFEYNKPDLGYIKIKVTDEVNGCLAPGEYICNLGFNNTKTIAYLSCADDYNEYKRIGYLPW